MLTLSYNEDTGLAHYEVKDEYFTPQFDAHCDPRHNCGDFPLSEQNIELAMKRYQPSATETYYCKGIEWKLSFSEALSNEIKNKLHEQTIMKILGKFTKDSNMPSIVPQVNGNPPPFINQKINQQWSTYKKYHAMLWEMGTGKTRSAVEDYEIKKKKKMVDHGLVVCPVSMINKWVVEIAQWSGNISAIGIKGSKEDKITILKEGWDWYVVSFETLSNMIEEFAAIINERWFVVLDEFTKIKNPHAKRAKACVRIGQLTRHKTILSGTPITQHAYDIFTPYLFLDGGKTFGINYEQFITQHFWRQGYKLIAKRNALKEIGDKIYTNATRFLKKDCFDIPDKVYDQRILELPPENKKRYDDMVNFCITQIEGSEKVTALVILTQLLRLSQITSGYVKDVLGQEVGLAENPKIDALEDILEESNGSQIIIWARFKWDCFAIGKLCDKMKIPYVFLHGEVTPDERTRNIEAFQTGRAKIVIGTASTGGHGIDLTAATIVIYYSNSYSLEQRLQSEDRAHRAGQKNQVTYIDLLCKNTIDTAIYKILRNKKNIADIVTKDNLRSLL